MILDDARVRLATFAWLEEQVRQHGDVLPRQVLAEGFRLDGLRVPLVAPQGIFKPAVLAEMPLSITTTTTSPYSDSMGADGLLRYSYRGQDPEHPENRGLRLAMRRHTPLVYLHSVVPGQYLAVWPVLIVGDDRTNLTFRVAVEETAAVAKLLAGDRPSAVTEAASEGRRAYLTTTIVRRLHQRGFRERVLRAYQDRCALCSLRHRELLDAAHIIPDREEDGDPHVRNGIALCKLHHAAYDAMFLAIHPDYRIVIRRDVLLESDGPMLRHGLQGLHGQPVILPRSEAQRPDRDLLNRRFLLFEARGA